MTKKWLLGAFWGVCLGLPDALFFNSNFCTGFIWSVVWFWLSSAWLRYSRVATGVSGPSEKFKFHAVAWKFLCKFPCWSLCAFRSSRNIFLTQKTFGCMQKNRQNAASWPFRGPVCGALLHKLAPNKNAGCWLQTLTKFLLQSLALNFYHIHLTHPSKMATTIPSSETSFHGCWAIQMAHFSNLMGKHFQATWGKLFEAQKHSKGFQPEASCNYNHRQTVQLAPSFKKNTCRKRQLQQCSATMRHTNIP